MIYAAGCFGLPILIPLFLDLARRLHASSTTSGWGATTGALDSLDRRLADYLR